jgi:hypothetical protein
MSISLVPRTYTRVEDITLKNGDLVRVTTDKDGHALSVVWGASVVRPVDTRMSFRNGWLRFFSPFSSFSELAGFAAAWLLVAFIGSLIGQAVAWALGVGR